jgi:hypothetical protein
MVQSRPHHLRHQWSQISTFVFLNHIHHHTYFKSSYVHIQVFHILHHHTMKLLLAFKSFLPRRLIVEIGCENWFAVGCPIWQRELVRCRLSNSAGRTVSLPAASSVAKTVSLLAPQFRQQMLTRSRQLSFGSESQFRCSQLNFGSDLLQTTPLWQRIASSLQNTPLGSELLIRCRRHSFDSESQFRCTTHNSAANANSLQKTQFRQRITNSLQTTQFRQRILIRCSRHSFGSESQIRCRKLSFSSEC